MNELETYKEGCPLTVLFNISGLELLPQLKEKSEEKGLTAAEMVAQSLKIFEGKFDPEIGIKSLSSSCARLNFTPAEDSLLLRGLEEFGHGCWGKIQQYYLPSKNIAQIANRYKNMTAKRAPDNPFKAFKLNGGEREELVLLEQGVSLYGHKNFDIISARLLPKRTPQELQKMWKAHKLKKNKELQQERANSTTSTATTSTTTTSTTSSASTSKSISASMVLNELFLQENPRASTQKQKQKDKSTSRSQQAQLQIQPQLPTQLPSPTINTSFRSFPAQQQINTELVYQSPLPSIQSKSGDSDDEESLSTESASPANEEMIDDTEGEKENDVLRSSNNVDTSADQQQPLPVFYNDENNANVLRSNWKGQPPTTTTITTTTTAGSNADNLLVLENGATFVWSKAEDREILLAAQSTGPNSSTWKSVSTRLPGRPPDLIEKRYFQLLSLLASHLRSS
eukprot:TRINITY_DN5803_c0_g3_i1.p1 TRINITY_DN5803_c0_g3~~TRINITY_DN5803_c0_g3_i1.p1  ORF type:complete len:454 (-),score=113.22 TRINITY_DN5803_c0_g3_i1:45-1406(-)